MILLNKSTSFRITIMALFLFLIGACGLPKPVLKPPPHRSAGPSIGLHNCTDFPSILIFDDGLNAVNRFRLASMTTRNFFTQTTLDGLDDAIQLFCLQETESIN